MEDTRSLLMMVLHKVFQNQPKTVEDTFRLIHNFNNAKGEKKNYETTLRTISHLMNDQLPSQILVYLLTLVDMPENVGSESSLVEKMRTTHGCLQELNVRPHLVEFLNNPRNSQRRSNLNSLKSVNPVECGKTNTPVSAGEVSCKSEAVKGGPITNTKENTGGSRQHRFLKPPRVARRTRKCKAQTAKPLLDICANYVVNNEDGLRKMYKNKLNYAWKLIEEETLSGKSLEQCYAVVSDLNKKSKWLRAIEQDVPTYEILMEEYGNSDVFLREKHVFSEVERDPFTISAEVKKEIDDMFYDSC